MFYVEQVLQVLRQCSTNIVENDTIFTSMFLI